MHNAAIPQVRKNPQLFIGPYRGECRLTDTEALAINSKPDKIPGVQGHIHFNSMVSIMALDCKSPGQRTTCWLQRARHHNSNTPCRAVNYQGSGLAGEACEPAATSQACMNVGGEISPAIGCKNWTSLLLIQCNCFLCVTVLWCKGMARLYLEWVKRKYTEMIVHDAIWFGRQCTDSTNQV